MKSSPDIAVPYLDHRLPRRGFWGHFRQLAIVTVIFVAISTLAVGYSLGYQINFQARTIQQTGSIYVNIRNDVPATIYINGQQQPAARPLTVSHLFPGQYALLVASSGFQSYSQVVEVDANKVSALHDLVLIRTIPQTVTVDQSWLPLTLTTPDSRVQILNENELWVNKQFVTRTSQNIIQANYYPDNRHIVYQEAGALWMLDLENETTELLLDGVGQTPLLYAFENGGQVLLYQKQNGTPQALGLY